MQQLKMLLEPDDKAVRADEKGGSPSVSYAEIFSVSLFTILAQQTPLDDGIAEKRL
ncbi:MAG: hypothetical protein ACLRRB_01490 [Ruminococcus sp.]